MSSKKKFKKFSKAQIIEQIKNSDSLSDKPKLSSTEVANQNISEKSDTISEESREVAYVKSDLRKIVMIFGLILVLLVGVIIVDKNTTGFGGVSDQLMKTLNIISN